jgi:metal-responsive CopG/Arc/MetJ family transcriptional regulator
MSDRVSIKIPRPLYVRLQQVIGDSGFSSPTDFIVFVLRDLVGTLEPERHGELSRDELLAVRKKLENLGYL